MKIVRPALLACAVCCVSLSAQPARLANISTRGQVGTDANNLFGGFVINGGSKTVLVRAIGPGLAAFGVPGTLADPTMTIFDSKNAAVASNDNWNAADGATFGQVGAFPLPAGSKDSVIVTTLPPGAYTAQISGLGSANTGVAILEVYDVSGGGQLVNIATRLNVGTGANAAVAGFVVSPGSGTRKLLVRGIGPALGVFGLQGFLPDPLLTVFDGGASVIASAVANGSVSALSSASAQAGAFASTAGDAATIVTVSPGNYTVQLSGNSGSTSGVGLIEVYDITNSTGTPANLASATPTLYYASLRPTVAATTSTGSGYATILFDPNTNVATVNVSMSGLSSTQTSAHLVIGTASSGNFVLDLPRGQVNGLTWTFPAKGTFSTSDLLNALKGGQIFVSLDSANFTSGELQGGFVQTAGSIAFTPPPAPPALAANALTAPAQPDAARFLMQATFGPTTADINTVMSGGITKWINDQMALPATSAEASAQADMAAFPNPPAPPGVMFEIFTHDFNWNATWLKMAVKAPDQLRQRVAFALSEIFVVGDGDVIDHNFESKTIFYDILINGAFGNLRQMLDDITLNPAMGHWLSYLANQKADPVKGTAPDENYAREVQQLFTIGLVQLQPDGTLMLDGSGQPIPTYNQTTISETAKVFTGWSYALAPANTTNVTTYINQIPDRISDAAHDMTSGFLVPMRYYDAFHDKTQKNIVSLQQVPLDQAKPTVIPANQTGPQDLKIMLDTLFNHPNIGPFLSKQLIQRLVTSNPSPAYVYRVAQVFANDGTGTRGNLGAVVKAILTDYEARSPAIVGNVGYGKIKEPIIRMTSFFRAMNVAAPNGRYMDGYSGDPRSGDKWTPAGTTAFLSTYLNQFPAMSPSVFNFFTPDYAPAGAVATAGLVAPEMQITDEVFAIQVSNPLMILMYRPASSLPANPPSPSPFLVIDYSAFLPQAKNSAALVDQFNLLFCANQMTATTRSFIINTVQTLPAAATDLDRVQTALQLVFCSPDGATQK